MEGLGFCNDSTKALLLKKRDNGSRGYVFSVERIYRFACAPQDEDIVFVVADDDSLIVKELKR